MNVIRPRQPNAIFQRLRPNPETVRTVSKYVKDTAIGVAGVGGVAVLADKLFGDSASDKKTRIHRILLRPLQVRPLFLLSLAIRLEMVFDPRLHLHYMLGNINGK